MDGKEDQPDDEEYPSDLRGNRSHPCQPQGTSNNAQYQEGQRIAQHNITGVMTGRPIMNDLSHIG